MVSQSVGRWGHSGGRSQAQADLALLGQPVDDLRLKVGVVDARLPEGPGVAVLLPVVVPVALLVGAVAEHRHLHTDSSLRRPPVGKLSTRPHPIMNDAPEMRAHGRVNTAGVSNSNPQAGPKRKTWTKLGANIDIYCKSFMLNNLYLMLLASKIDLETKEHIGINQKFKFQQ